MKRILLLISLFLIVVLSVQAQKLSELPQQQRDSILLLVAKAAVLRYGPDYYREYKTPSISFLSKYKSQTGPNTWKDGDIYIVTFFYDQSKERLAEDFAAKVSIWDDTKRAFSIYFGNAWGYFNLDKPETRSNPDNRKMPYQALEEPEKIDLDGGQKQ